MSTLFITHNMGVVASICDRVAVMYAGSIVEVGTVSEVLRSPEHPYTAALLRAAPSQETIGERPIPIKGALPDMVHPPAGCRFAARCEHASVICEREPNYREVNPGRRIRCWQPWRGYETNSTHIGVPTTAKAIDS
jgi:oligopeptide/dipeptide ABC transporter ATP-binding protein